VSIVRRTRRGTRPRTGKRITGGHPAEGEPRANVDDTSPTGGKCVLGGTEHRSSRSSFSAFLLLAFSFFFLASSLFAVHPSIKNERRSFCPIYAIDFNKQRTELTFFQAFERRGTIPYLYTKSDGQASNGDKFL